MSSPLLTVRSAIVGRTVVVFLCNGKGAGGRSFRSRHFGLRVGSAIFGRRAFEPDPRWDIEGAQEPPLRLGRRRHRRGGGISRLVRVVLRDEVRRRGSAGGSILRWC